MKAELNNDNSNKRNSKEEKVRIYKSILQNNADETRADSSHFKLIEVLTIQIHLSDTI